MKITLSCDDAAKSDLRLANLCRKYKVKAVFYWPVDLTAVATQNGFEPLSPQEANMIAKDFEIGSHTLTHRHLTKMPEDEAKQEILDSKLFLQNLYDQPIDNFAPPRGYLNDTLTEFAQKFYKKIRLTKGKGLVHIHPNSGANDNKHWLNMLDGVTELWCHSWELDKYNQWEELEAYLARS